jgi:hypothetical protein
MTRHPLPSLLIAAALLAGTLPVSAEASDVWRAVKSGSFVTLRYGAVDPRESPVFLLSCLNGVGIAVLSVYMDFPERQSGDPIAVELSAGEQATSVAGETASEDGTGIIYGEAGDIEVKPILKVLREKGPVSMKVDANGTELSDADRSQAVEQFAKDCTLD